MPRRTNDFQRLVYLVRVNLAEGATVTESKMLVDRSTGTEREVDVCIEEKIGTHPVIVCVACRDHARIADVGWVDQKKGKHARLLTNALILASKKGFPLEARNAAEAHGIATISLSEVEDFDFPHYSDSAVHFGRRPSAFHPKRVLFRVNAPDIDESVAVSPDNTLFSEEGESLGSAMDVVRPLVNSPRAIDQKESQEEKGRTWKF
jgi:hypothetical protein